LIPADTGTGDRLGGAIATDGTRVIVGAVSDDDRGSASGAAYIFYHGTTGWVQEAKLVPADIGPGDLFGLAVDIANDRAIVGSYSIDGATGGVAYIYELVNGIWTQAARLRPSTTALYDQYGVAVGISRDMAIVGAPYDDDFATDAGCAFVYLRGTTGWTQRTIFTPLQLEVGDHFGSSVDVAKFWSSWSAPAGYYLAIGAPGDDDAGAACGSLYVYHKEPMVDPGWSHVKLIPAGLSAGSALGTSLALNGYYDTYLIAGAPYDATNGRAHVYRMALSGGDWSYVAALAAGDGLGGTTFGRSVAIAGGNDDWLAIVGAPYATVGGYSTGAAYLYEKSGSGFAELPRLVAHDRTSSDYFGTSVGVSWNTAAVGASGDDDRGSNSGSFYVFSDQSGTRLSGWVWKDCDGDGVCDLQDTGLAGWQVLLDTNANHLPDAGEWLAVTGADGSYLLADVPPGSYAVIAQVPAGWSCTHPVDPQFYPITLGVGQQLSGLDFGNYYLATDADGARPRLVHLEPIAPNPFNPGALIAYDLSTAAPVQLQILNLRGQLVRSLADQAMPAGRHLARWDGLDRDGRPVASGLYVVQLRAAGTRLQSKLMLVK
jgi:hypothetical protein